MTIDEGFYVVLHSVAFALKAKKAIVFAMIPGKLKNSSIKEDNFFYFLI